MAGYPITKDIINSRAGYLVKTLDDTLDGIVTLSDYLDGNSADDLGLGFTPEEVTLLRAAFTALAKLSDIAHGQDVQAQASDFFFDAKQLTGLD
jgi:hypothetical protein